MRLRQRLSSDRFARTGNRVPGKYRATKRLGQLIVTLLAASLLSSCVESRPYRLEGIAKGQYDREFPGQEAHFEEVKVLGKRNYRLSFVEFDDKGDFWDRRQLGKTAQHIQSSDQPVMLVIFIHGWHHNAADRKGGKNPGDVETFRCLLSQLAVSNSARHLQIHGVYLGWRGRLVHGPLDYLTFLGRKGAATRVAGTPVTETIFELIRQTRKHRYGGSSKSVVIGHSFGALVLEKAMAQAIAGSVLAQDTESEGRGFNAPADLIMLVNSAAESIYAKELSDMFARIGHRGHINAQRPLVVSITSKTDKATKGWFPVGTFLPNLFARRKYHWGDRFGRSSDEVSQHEYLTRTPGHNELLFTHTVVPAPPNTGKGPNASRPDIRSLEVCLEGNTAFEENLQRPRGMTFATASHASPETLDWWTIVPRENIPPTPYWIMHVPPQIVHDHSPIFTPEGRAMMAALFRITNPRKDAGPRQMSISSE